jgi:hypothetical protein
MKEENLLQILVRNGAIWILLLPVNVHDPPALSVVESWMLLMPRINGSGSSSLWRDS